MSCDERVSLRPGSYFRFDALVGRHPKERPEDIYVKRTDPVTKVVNRVPEMMGFVTNGRKYVPLHRLIEDDWRAYRIAYHDFARKMMLMTSPRHDQCLQDTDYHINAAWGLPPIAYSDAYRYPKQVMERALPKKRSIPLTVFKGPFQSVVPVKSCAKTRPVRKHPL